MTQSDDSLIQILSLLVLDLPLFLKCGIMFMLNAKSVVSILITVESFKMCSRFKDGFLLIFH